MYNKKFIYYDDRVDQNLGEVVGFRGFTRVDKSLHKYFQFSYNKKQRIYISFKFLLETSLWPPEGVVTGTGGALGADMGFENSLHKYFQFSYN